MRFTRIDITLLIFNLYIYFILPPASAQLNSSNPRPSIVTSRGYSVNTTISTGTVNQIQGEQLEATSSVNVVLQNAQLQNNTSGEMVDFMVTPTSSNVQLSNLDSLNLYEFGEGTILNSKVKSKDSVAVDTSVNQATSSAFIIIETELSSQENISSFSESFDSAF